jgi:hypothetical protein
LKELAGKKVGVVGGVKQFTQISDKGMKIVDAKGNSVFMAADNVVVTAGSRADKALSESLKGEAAEIYEVGDCQQARHIAEAIYDGAQIGFKI